MGLQVGVERNQFLLPSPSLSDAGPPSLVAQTSRGPTTHSCFICFAGLMWGCQTRLSCRRQSMTCLELPEDAVNKNQLQWPWRRLAPDKTLAFPLLHIVFIRTQDVGGLWDVQCLKNKEAVFPAMAPGQCHC